MYKKETIKKYLEMARYYMEKYSNAREDELKLCISKRNVKVPCMNVSTAPIIACFNCSHCMDYCYDVKACLRFPEHVLEKRVINYVLATKYRSRYFAEIDKLFTARRKCKFFRWHQAGEILDMDYLQEMVNTALRHPDWKYWTYTKVYGLVNQFCRMHGGRNAIPENLVIMFSGWDGVPMENPYGFPEFHCKLKDGNTDHGPEFFESLYKCPGACGICIESGRGCPFGESAYADEH